MPDQPIQNNTAQNNAPPPVQQDTGTKAPERPTWLPSEFKSPEEFATKYNEINERWTKAEPSLKAAEKWARWGDPEQFEKNLAARIAERDKQQRAAWEAETRQQAPADRKDPFENWELLEPRQQAAAMSQLIEQAIMQRVNESIQNYWKQAQGQLTDTDQRFNLLSRALMERTGNPNLDLNKLWQEANNLATGDPNQLFTLALERATANERQQKQIADAIAAEKQKWEQEAQNRAQAALLGASGGATTSSFKDTINARHGADGKPSLRERIVQKLRDAGQLSPGYQ